MDNGGKNGNKSAERSSPTPLTMVGVSTARDRTALLNCSGGRDGSDPMAWLSQFLMEFDMGSKEKCSSTRMCRRQCQECDVARCLESLKWLASVVINLSDTKARVRKLVDERCGRASAIPLPQAAFRELLGSHSVHGPDGNGNLANFSTVELVSLPHSLLDALVSVMLCRHFLEIFQSMIKSKAELENLQLPLLRLGTQCSRGIVQNE